MNDLESIGIYEHIELEYKHLDEIRKNISSKYLLAKLL